MKADMDRRKHALAIASHEVEPVAEALAQAWSDLQELKDCLSLVLQGSFDIDLKNAAKEAEVRLANGYKVWGAQLPGRAAKAWHDAKNKAGNVPFLIFQLLNPDLIDEHPYRPTAEELESRCENLRRALSEFQTEISAARAMLREDQMRRLLEILS